MRDRLLRLWRLPAGIHYSIAVFSVVVVAVARWLCASPDLNRQPFLLFGFAVTASAFAGGLGPGALTTALSICLGTALMVVNRMPIDTASFAISMSSTFLTWAALCVVCGILRREALTTELARSKLEEVSDRLLFVLDAIPDACCVVDHDWRIQFANQAMRTAPGAATAIGSRYELESRFNREEIESLEAAMQDGLPRFMDVARGSEWVHVRAFPFDVGLLIFEQDISEAKRLQLRRSALVNLEREARRNAEDSARNKDNFLLTVSHELRTPLTTILGWSEILLSPDSEREATVRGITAIDRSARSQSALIEQLLDLAELSNSGHPLELEVLDLREAVELALERVGPSFVAAGQALTQEVPEEELLVRGDQGHLVKAIAAVLDNASRYTPREGSITVRTTRRESSAVAEIEDSGMGIEPEFLPHVFDRFTQREGALARRYNGLGLGLTIAKASVDLHGGSLEANSEGTNKGTQVRISLPLAPIGRPRGSSREPLSTSPFETLASSRILVVDDDPGTREVLAHFLNSMGASVLLAGSGRDALDIALSESIDVIISDLGMPEMSGLELIERLRRDPKTVGLPVLALSAYNRADVRVMCTEAGFDDFANKPIERAVLLDKVARMVAMRRPS